MKIAWENDDWPGAHIEPAINNLTWMPFPDRPGHGLLGVGNESASVGITVTDLLPTDDDNQRYNYNLRGHHSPITMVTWNKEQQKLASCDASGVIYVWVRNEDRWTVELVNDRGVKVRDLCWSPSGVNALICYDDNFVLIGSSTGQRVWSNTFPTTSTVCCGVWAPNSNHLVLGFNNGQLQVMTKEGNNVTERTLTSDSLQKLAFSLLPNAEDKWTLAALTATNKVLMVTSFDQIEPDVYESYSNVVQIDWNPAGTILALINEYHQLIMLDSEARVIHSEIINLPRDKPLSAFTWAHDGQVLIVSGGGHLAVGKLHHGVPPLFNLVTYELWKLLGKHCSRVDRLPIPTKEKESLRALDHHIIRCRVPRPEDFCNYTCSVFESRCYCTIKPMARGSHAYVLCMEHLGGLVPLLIGRQVNRFLPQFQISIHPGNNKGGKDVEPAPIGSSAQVEDASIIPRASTGRNSLWRRSKRQLRALMSRHVRPAKPDLRLVQVSSNLWCTRFFITSLSPKNLPGFLGQVVYKTSVLHLQPRQMTIDMAIIGKGEENDSRSTSSICPSPAATLSESDVDELAQLIQSTRPNRDEDDGLTREERAFFDRVVSECTSLRAAMDANTYTSQGTSQVAASKDIRLSPGPARSESRQDDIDLSMSTTSTWQDEIESLEFIDGADDRQPLLAVAPCSPKKEKCKSQRNDNEDIKAHLDRLARSAAQLGHRHAEFNTKRDRVSINKMRSQMKELLRRVNEIEKKVGVGKGDVRKDLRELMRNLEEIKKALGEGPSAPRPSSRMITMHNKTPFWNEHNQVYQLDFGGRVTQESAKNFQVELNGSQVLQFGRIEGGAYTLDFRKPFSTSQAFAVALASITQRLK